MNLKFLKTCRQTGKAWLPVILWLFLIFYLSHQPDLKSGFPNLIDFVLRKIAHITEYAILCFLLIRATSSKKWSFLIAFLYAISDEFHQLFVFGRHGSPRDVGIDTVGMILAVLLFDKICKILERFKIYDQLKKTF